MTVWRKGLALGILEFSSIPLGMRTLNNVSKEVNLENVSDQLMSSSRYIGFIVGEYGAIQHAVEYAIEASSNSLIDVAIVGKLQNELLDYANNKLNIVQENVINLLVFDSCAHARAIESTNILLHSTELHLLKIDSSDYLDGKTLVSMYGSIANVKKGQELLGEGEVITNLTPTMRKMLFKGSVKSEND